MLLPKKTEKKPKKEGKIIDEIKGIHDLEFQAKIDAEILLQVKEIQKDVLRYNRAMEVYNGIIAEKERIAKITSKRIKESISSNRKVFSKRKKTNKQNIKNRR